MQQFIAIDLGTTNIKVGLYSERLDCVALEHCPVRYLRNGTRVEFDAEAYFDALVAVLGRLLKRPGAQPRLVGGIALTGQAESLVVLGGNDRPIMNAISWMDERSVQECRTLEARFAHSDYAAVTGQQAILPTWPATKILWLRGHRPDLFSHATRFVLLKDYIGYRLTGRLLADCSIATFTFYFDIYRRRYWPEMLESVGISEDQLPPLAEPCTAAGPLTAEIAAQLGLRDDVAVNIGTLDHFAGMIGVGNTRQGIASLSTGTVMALAVMAAPGTAGDTRIAMHYGFLPGTYVMLPVAESGGICLEWFRDTCLPGVGFAEIDAALERREAADNGIIFLPYLVGSNAPELDTDVSGVFFGLRSQHDGYDMAHAVMEGVAHMLRKNCDHIAAAGTPVSRIIATGGGAKSALWCQLQADVTGIPVEVPDQSEAACLGTAIIAAVAAGAYRSYEEATGAAVRIRRRFLPRQSGHLTRKYRQFEALYKAMAAIQRIE